MKPHSRSKCRQDTVASTDNESGLGLVELLIYIALMLIALGAVGGLLIGMFNVNNEVTGSVNAAGQAQVTAESVESGVRNATAVSVQNVGANSQLLLTRTATTTANSSFLCQAWYFDSANGGSIRFKQSQSAITAPDSTSLASWSLLIEGVQPSQIMPLFRLVGRRLDVNFTATKAKQTPVVINTSASVRAETWESAPCF